MYYGGVSGRGVGTILQMNKSNVMNWIKKERQKKSAKKAVEACKKASIVELDELYWFLEYKPRTETRENVYLITMVSRKPRQIVGHVVSRNRSARTIQRMVDKAEEAEIYCTDGYSGYLDVVFPGKHLGRSYCFRSCLQPVWPSQRLLSFPPSRICCPFFFLRLPLALRLDTPLHHRCIAILTLLRYNVYVSI